MSTAVPSQSHVPSSLDVRASSLDLQGALRAHRIPLGHRKSASHVSPFRCTQEVTLAAAFALCAADVLPKQVSTSQ